MDIAYSEGAQAGPDRLPDRKRDNRERDPPGQAKYGYEQGNHQEKIKAVPHRFSSTVHASFHVHGGDKVFGTGSPRPRAQTRSVFTYPFARD